MRVGELAGWLGANVEGEADREVTGVASLEAATETDVAFASGRKAAQGAAASRAGCLLVAHDFSNAAGRTVIRTDDPRAAFARLVRKMHPPAGIEPGIHPTACIAPGAAIGARVSIAAHAILGEGCRVGYGTVIGPACVIGGTVTVGDNCRLHAGVTVYDGCRIGNRVTLHSGCVIGADGFGFILSAGRYEKFPQIGTVEIGDDVEIGANSCVDRAALGVTFIGEGTKLDNLVHVAHNCRIGRHVVVAAQTGFSGGVEVGDYAVIGGQVGIGDKARIESRAVVGSGAGILTSKIVRAGEPVWGTPARPLKEHLAALANLSRLSRLREEVADLKKHLAELGSR